MKSIDAIHWAYSQLGVREAGTTNNVVYNTNYYGYPVSGTTVPYCCVWIWNLFVQCGAPQLFNGGRRTASCITLLDWARKAGLVISDPRKALPGDVVLFDWNGNGVPDHVGLVDYVDTVANKLHTIEGNSSPAVEQKVRSWTDVLAIYRPAYDPEYNTLEDLPEWARPAIQWYIDNGYLAGAETGLQLSQEMLRILVINWRIWTNESK